MGKYDALWKYVAKAGKVQSTKAQRFIFTQEFQRPYRLMDSLWMPRRMKLCDMFNIKICISLESTRMKVNQVRISKAVRDFSR